MAYVPPALRKRAQGSASDGTTADAAGSHENLPPDVTPPKTVAGPNFHISDIHTHYWGRSPSMPTSGTLNSSAQDPDILKYITLFNDANPRWQSHGIIFVKTRLYILPGGERFKDDPLSRGGGTPAGQPGKVEDEKKDEKRDGSHGGEALTEEAGVVTSEAPSVKSPAEENQASEEARVSEEELSRKDSQDRDEGVNPPEDIESKMRASARPDPDPPFSPDLSLYSTGPIAVFEQPQGCGGGRGAPFIFAGYFKITSLEYLSPHSKELFRLLEQKFTLTDRRGRVRQKQRSEESWRDSLKHRWAVVQMERDEDADGSLPPPEIEVRGGSAGGAGTSPKKSVNELLKEMRLNG